jgi:hypothetical protein
VIDDEHCRRRQHQTGDQLHPDFERTLPSVLSI